MCVCVCVLDKPGNHERGFFPHIRGTYCMESVSEKVTEQLQTLKFDILNQVA